MQKDEQRSIELEINAAISAVNHPSITSSPAEHLLHSDAFARYLIKLRQMPGRAISGWAHPNGFAKIVLFANSQVGSVRLHLWPPGARESDVHNHRWDFDSVVLEGEVICTNFSLREGSSFNLLQCRRSGERYEMSFLRRTDIVEIQTFAVGHGASYFQHRKLFHSPQTGQSGATTLIVRGRPRQRTTLVARPTTVSTEDSTAAVAKPMSRSDLVDAVAYLSELLQ